MKMKCVWIICRRGWRMERGRGGQKGRRATPLDAKQITTPKPHNKYCMPTDGCQALRAKSLPSKMMSTLSLLLAPFEKRQAFGRFCSHINKGIPTDTRRIWERMEGDERRRFTMCISGRKNKRGVKEYCEGAGVRRKGGRPTRISIVSHKNIRAFTSHSACLSVSSLSGLVSSMMSWALLVLEQEGK